MSLNQHISCSKLAKMLDVTPRTIRNWAVDCDDPLPGYKVKGIRIFDVEQVQEWLKRHDNTIDIDAKLNEILNSFKEA